MAPLHFRAAGLCLASCLVRACAVNLKQLEVSDVDSDQALVEDDSGLPDDVHLVVKTMRSMLRNTTKDLKSALREKQKEVRSAFKAKRAADVEEWMHGARRRFREEMEAKEEEEERKAFFKEERKKAVKGE
eukprot:CAMPEP_0171090218 /NCGR_PEP_ID=MMETSP0766_2-20121228/29643_1 /TAXON_ID=439317 /ORGANISM="Gambierdiscus australes, Strain CAWD 149" /LENGTH=130 /DNA_ID=CAMNT_0011548187 /DNA_START=60 /DNA_END=452 /DNA_ORIENTATION=+